MRALRRAVICELAAYVVARLRLRGHRMHETKGRSEVHVHSRLRSLRAAELHQGEAMKLTTTRRLGATDAAKLLGVSKYGGPREVFDRIVNGIETKTNPRMERGTKYESEVRRRYVEATGAQLQQFVARPLIVEHPAHHWATSSPDDITVDGVLAEYKTTSRWAKGWDPIPIDYVLQVQWSLWVCGLETAHLYAAFGEDGDAAHRGEFYIERCHLYTLRRDDELADIFAEVGERFWRTCIETKSAPTEEQPHV